MRPDAVVTQRMARKARLQEVLKETHILQGEKGHLILRLARISART